MAIKQVVLVFHDEKKVPLDMIHLATLALIETDAGWRVKKDRRTAHGIDGESLSDQDMRTVLTEHIESGRTL